MSQLITIGLLREREKKKRKKRIDLPCRYFKSIHLIFILNYLDSWFKPEREFHHKVYAIFSWA